MRPPTGAHFDVLCRAGASIPPLSYRRAWCSERPRCGHLQEHAGVSSCRAGALNPPLSYRGAWCSERPQCGHLQVHAGVSSCRAGALNPPLSYRMAWCSERPRCGHLQVRILMFSVGPGHRSRLCRVEGLGALSGLDAATYRFSRSLLHFRNDKLKGVQKSTFHGP